MRVTKVMHHRDLHSNYGVMKFSSRLLMNPTGVRMLNRNSARQRGKGIEGLDCQERFIPSRNGGPAIRVRIFRPLGTHGPLPGMLYLHGGGYMLGNPEDFLPVIQRWIGTRPCVVVAPDYRKSLDAPYPAAFHDGYDTLLWMHENAQALGLLDRGLIVAGHSSGGGLAAAVTLKATETRAVPIAFQVPVYPMLDDRQDTESARDNNSAGWNSRSNRLGWSLYLRDLVRAGAEIPPYAAPARAHDLSGMPPTITFVGDLEPFRDETVAYVKRLEAAGVPVEFRLFPGCYHAFEVLFPQLSISQEAWSFLLNAFGRYVDRYFHSNPKETV